MSSFPQPAPPAELVRNLTGEFGAAGAAWLAALPARLDRLARRWGLADLTWAPGASWNAVLFARQGGADVVLKAGLPGTERDAEARALRHFAGRGGVAVLDEAPDEGAILLERVRPGHPLAAEAARDDDRATVRAAAVLARLAALAPPADTAGLERVADHAARALAAARAGAFPAVWAGRAERLAARLARPAPVGLLHGDFHHHNLLEGPAGLVALDPKGFVGPVGNDVGVFLYNPREPALAPDALWARTDRRLARFAAALGRPPGELRAWSVAAALVSAAWSVGGGERPAGVLAVAEALWAEGDG